MDATHRHCAKCLELKPLTDFSPHPRGLYGKQSRCKPCCAKANSERYYANHDVAKEKARLRALADQRRNPEKRRAQREAWRKRNPDLDRKIKREWNRSHPDYVRENHRRRDRDKNRAYTRTYRAKKLGNGGKHTPADLDRLLVEQVGRCVYCREPLKRYEVDHRTPLARGGSNGPENLQLLCVPCNRSKGARTHEEHLTWTSTTTSSCTRPRTTPRRRRPSRSSSTRT